MRRRRSASQRVEEESCLSSKLEDAKILGGRWKSDAKLGGRVRKLKEKLNELLRKPDILRALTTTVIW